MSQGSIRPSADTGAQSVLLSYPGKVARRQIIVLGMHRSGTSAVAGVLNAMGAFVGGPEALTKRSWENACGFFERQDARKICDTLLHRSGADWWRISAFDPESVPHSVLKEQTAEIRRLLAELDTHGTWTLKEPRLCLVLSIFLRFLRDPVIVQVVRNPIEVARSLRFRNGVPTRAGLALWEAYNVSCLRQAADLPRVVVNYDALVSDPQPTLRSLSQQLRGVGVQGLDPDRGAAMIDKSLRREHDEKDELRFYLTRPQLSLWNHLTGKRKGKFKAKVSESALATLREFEADEIARRDLEATVGRLSKDISRHGADKEKLRVEVTRLTGNLRRSQEEIGELKGRIKAFEQRIRFLKGTVSWRLTAPLRAVYRAATGRPHVAKPARAEVPRPASQPISADQAKEPEPAKTAESDRKPAESRAEKLILRHPEERN
jgi:hypothetical protein